MIFALIKDVIFRLICFLCSVRMAICVLFAFASFSIVAFSRVLWITLLGEINEAVGEIYTCARVLFLKMSILASWVLTILVRSWFQHLFIYPDGRLFTFPSNSIEQSMVDIQWFLEKLQILLRDTYTFRFYTTL